MRNHRLNSKSISLTVNKLTILTVLIFMQLSADLFAGRPTRSAMTAASYVDAVYYNNLYFAANRWGVEVFEIVDGNDLVSLSRTATRGRAEFLDAEDGLAAVSNLDGIIELFYIDGKMLRPAGSIEPGFHPTALRIIGDYLYVGGLEVSLTVYDIANPRFPEQIGEVIFEGYPHDYVIRNDTLFIAAYHGGVVLIDIEVPARPSVIRQYDLGSYVYGIALDGQYIYTCAHSSGLVVLDMTRPDMPPVVGYNSQFGSARKAILTQEGLLVLDGFGSVSMVDISSLSQPQILWSQSLDFNCYDFILVDDFLAVANWNNGFRLYKAELKAGLEFLDEEVNYSVCRSVAVSDGRVYAGGGTGGLFVYDRELNQAEAQGFVAGENCLEVKTAGPYGFLSNGEYGITIVDISNPADLKFISNYQSRGWVRSSACSDNILFLANWQGIVVLDIIRINDPLEINFLDTDCGTSKVEYRNDTLFAVGSGGLELYNVVNPNNIFSIGSFRTAYPAVGLEMHDELLIVSSGLGGVDILTLSGGLNLLSHIEAMECAAAAEYNEGTLFVAENHSGISEWDVTQPQNPIYVQGFLSTGRAVDLEFYEGKLYVADYYGVTMFETGRAERFYSDYSDLAGENELEIVSYPNPVNGGANLRFELASPANMQVSIYDLLGRKVKSVFSGYLGAGENRLSWNCHDIASGCYYMNVRGAGYSATKQVTVIK